MADSLQWLFDRLAGFGDQPFLTREHHTATYADLLEAMLDAETMAQRDPKRILVLQPDYDLHTVAILLAYLKAGHTVAPLTALPESTRTEYEGLCQASERIQVLDADVSRHAIADSDTPPPLIRRLQDNGRPGLVLFSSGTTGQPKAMVHDAGHFLAQYTDRRSRRMSILLFLLFDHIGGLNTLFGSLASGMHMIAPTLREPDVIAQLIQKHQIAILPTTPTFLNLLLMSRAHERFNLSSLRIITYGAEAMPEALLKRLRTAFPKVKFVQTFGTSETGIAKTSKATAGAGQLVIDDPNQEYRIVDGELWLRSRTQILGYLNTDDQRITDDGWFMTGDLVEEIQPGTLRILSRKNDLINVGGEKVYPSEVESFLMEMPQVAACKVYGQANPITGNAVAADVVPSSDMPPTDLRSAIRRHVRAHLPRHKAPVTINIVDALAMSKRFKSRPTESA